MKKHTAVNRSLSGFSLLEILIVVSLLGGMLFFRLPDLINVYNKARVRHYTIQLKGIIKQARRAARQHGGARITFENGQGEIITKSKTPIINFNLSESV